MIVSLPALEYLAADYTEVWTTGANVPLVRFANRVRSIVSTGLDSYPPRLKALESFDEIVSWYGSNRPEFGAALTGYPVRFLEALPISSKLHAVDFYMQQVGGPMGAVPSIPCPRDNQGFIAIHPFSGSSKKNWPGFAELAARLPGPVRFCAGPEQSWPGAEQYQDLYDLAQWLATASLYIGNDSGITHLAAAVGVPVIAIFQASDPAIWAPRGFAPTTVLEDPDVDAVLSVAATI